MKTVSGKITSTKPVSLSKASKIISNFVLSDHEASPAVAAYLKRTSAAFNELVELHKELKSDRKKKRHGRSTTEETETVITEHSKEENQAAAAGSENNSKRNQRKEKKDRKRKEVNLDQAVDCSADGNGSLKKTKKRKSEA